MTHIVFTGPECSGKTTLSTEIAKIFNAPLVQEYARDYLNKNGPNYQYSDLLQIAKGQLKIEEKHKKKKNQIIICDTNLQVIKIWSQIKYSKCDEFILKNQNPNAYYILCYPDFPWVQDPLRESPNDRLKLFSHYLNDLKKNQYNFTIVRGSVKNRISIIASLINKMFLKKI